ncbi:MAG: DNA topoisomerase IB [Chthoniobacterales bacterium]
MNGPSAEIPNPFVDALQEEAREAGLRYTHDDRPGIRREKRGEEIVYLHPNGTPVDDDSTLTRIKRLAIPPAWTDVWICPLENCHIQATGRDARRRKQYRYHPKWREHRDENKFGRMIAFARVLPKIRRRVKRDLARRGMPREKVLATVVSLLEGTLIRVGNDEYVKQNGSYGLTTMRNRHVRVRGAKIEFAFKGKSGVRHEIAVKDPQLAKIVRRCQEMPGQDLFEYEGEDGELHTITSQDVNEYLRGIAGEDFSAKDFRTWAGTVLAAIALREFEAFDAQAEAKRNVVSAIEAVAKMLGNTPSVCRKCYVHPVILDSYLTGDTIATVQQRVEGKIDRSLSKLKPEEAAVLILLQQKLKTNRRSVKARS